ncbi:hypothetical protein [Streptomyces sp. 8L]|uniref:hypothetical protein n=1 Tax=Streptomyces sp. 8L TaxID=2877242 RepID=UPI001CD535E4|nr:hypothetical protein [Streptomyces sp. 8L]MCA1217391.1 hypothetical protein [Streptomyces sp. 8L]
MTEDTEDIEQTEFRVVCETGDIEQYDDYHDAWAALATAVKRDIEEHGEETARESGVIHPYGYTINVVCGGSDITEDWARSEPYKPLDMG